MNRNWYTFRQSTHSNIHKLAEDQAAQLKLIYPADGAANALVDIILVAGLGGDYINTWKADDGTVWPRDLLPKHIPKIRVLSFRYNTTIKGTTSRGKIADHARQLLNALDLDRETDIEAATRPIIFVGHSLGGMLIKYAIHLAYQYQHHRYGGLWDASRGVMFFATPHHGMSSSAWRDFATAVLCLNAPYPGVRPTESMLKELALNTDVLLNITEDFKMVQQELAFVNFVEGNVMAGKRQVLVDKSHGWMDAPKKQECVMEGDHIRVCQFGRSKADRGSFQRVSTSMRYLIEESPKAINQVDGDAMRALYSLCPTGFHGYFMAKERTEGTCEWISERPEFQEWLDDENDKQLLWIQGPPACGKSYLAKHIITELAPAANKEVSHCFLSDSMPGRGNIAALLRATLHHALRRERQLTSEILVPLFLEATKNKIVRAIDDEIWTREKLIPMWPDAVARVLSNRPLTLVVDGFDQIDRECQQNFIDCLSECKIKAGDEGVRRLRVLLLSSESEAEEEKPEPLIGQEEFQVYHVTPEDTLPDIAKTVMKQLSAPSGEQGLTDSESKEREGAETLRKGICEAVMQHSNGSYLQAAKAAEVLAETPLAISNLETALDRLETLPTNNLDFHIQHLNSILDGGKNKPLLEHVLRWAVFQLEPLREVEFYTAVSLGMAMDQQQATWPQRGTFFAQRQLESSLQQVDEIKLLVQTHCQKLVDLGEGHLQLAHSSMRKFLTSGEVENALFYKQLNTELARSMEDLPSQEALARTCMAYLTLPYFQHAGSPASPNDGGDNEELWKSKVRRRIKDYPFVRYASLNWFRHLDASKQRSASSFGFSDGGVMTPYYPGQDEEQLELLQDSTAEYARCWTEVFWFLTNGSTTRLHEFSPCLVIRTCFPSLPASRTRIHPAITEEASPLTIDFMKRATTDERAKEDSPVSDEKPSARDELPDASPVIDESTKIIRENSQSRVTESGPSSGQGSDPGVIMQMELRPEPPKGVAVDSRDADSATEVDAKHGNVLANDVRNVSGSGNLDDGRRVTTDVQPKLTSQQEHKRGSQPLEPTLGESDPPTLAVEPHSEMREDAERAWGDQEEETGAADKGKQEVITLKPVDGENNGERVQEKMKPTVAEPKHREGDGLSAKQAIDEAIDYVATTLNLEGKKLNVKDSRQSPDLQSSILLSPEAKHEPKRGRPAHRLGTTKDSYFPASAEPTAAQPSDPEPTKSRSGGDPPTQTHRVPPSGGPPASPVQLTQRTQHYQQAPQLQEADELAKPSDSRGRAEDKPESTNFGTIVKSSGDRKASPQDDAPPHKQRRSTDNGSIQASKNGSGLGVEESPVSTGANGKKSKESSWVVAKLKRGAKKVEAWLR